MVDVRFFTPSVGPSDSTSIILVHPYRNKRKDIASLTVCVQVDAAVNLLRVSIHGTSNARGTHHIQTHDAVRASTVGTDVLLDPDMF